MYCDYFPGIKEWKVYSYWATLESDWEHIYAYDEEEAIEIYKGRVSDVQLPLRAEQIG